MTSTLITKKTQILIIGNGQSVLKNKLKFDINNFNNVGRINNYKINGYEDYIGSKTSIWFNGANQGLTKKAEIPDNIIIFIPSAIQKKGTDLHSRIKSRIGIKKEQYKLVTKNKIIEYEKKCNSNRLTTGTYSILWALENYKEVYIYGFDFFIDSKSHYYDNKLISTLKNKWIIPKAKKHDMNKEKKYINELVHAGKVKILNG